MSKFSDRPHWGPILEAAIAGQDPLVRARQTPESVGRMVSGLVYVASPYSKQVRVNGTFNIQRGVEMAMQAARAVAELAERGVSAVSPVALSDLACGSVGYRIDPLDHAFWMRWCAPLLAASRAVVVPDIEGWDRSVGVWQEVCQAIERNVPVYLYAGRDAA